MHNNSKNNIKDKLISGPATTGSYASSTDANITAASAGAEGDDSHDLFINFKTDKKRV